MWLHNDTTLKRIVRKVDKAEGGIVKDSDVRKEADDRMFDDMKAWPQYTANRTLVKQTQRMLRFFPQKHVRGGRFGHGGHSPSWHGREQT